ncbi:MAG: DJ-1/PfpI family protein [Clostridia bacterium]|nr:DJ-1/PfpI family protein [Clostridia bacterium]
MLYLFLADGFEETEAVAPLDIVRRAEIPIKTVAIDENPVTGAHGIAIQADLTLNDVDMDAMEGMVLPGGMPGTLNLQKNPQVIALLHHCAEQKKLIAAICAAPMIPGSLGLLEGKKAVCFPGFEDQLEGAILEDQGVVVDGNYITAKGAGTALEFGAAIVDYCYQNQENPGKGKRLLSQMQFHYDV